MSDVLWRIVERRLQRALPPAHAASTSGDLAEDYARRCTERGRVLAAVWLIREAASLAYAYRLAAPHKSGPRVMLASEIRCAVKRLRARAGSSLACAALLAVGIGLCTAAFSAVDAVLLQPAPFRDADRLVRQTVGYAEPALVEAWRTSGMFDAVGASRAASFQFQMGTEARSLPAAAVTPGMFDLLDVSPLRGRTFSAISSHAGPTDEVIVSETIWQTLFGRDPALLGRRIPLDTGSVVVVGIMPAAFRFPTPSTVVWKPLFPAANERGLFTIVGRLKPGVPFVGADTRAQALAAELARLPRNYRGGPPLQRVAVPELGEFTGRALWILLAGAAIVFAVLCANVSGLVLTTLWARRRECAMCTALGASRARLVREAAVEHALIGVVGAGAGVWLAWGLTTLVPGVFQGHTLNPIDIDVRALVTASSLGLASVILSGLIPAWLGTETDPVDSLRGSREAGTGTRVARLTTSSLLVVEIAFACSLLVGSALLVRSFANLVQTDLGLNGDGIVRVSVGGLDDVYAARHVDGQAAGNAMALGAAAIEARFAAWPAVSAVALSREIPPLPAQASRAPLSVPGRPDLDPGVEADRYRVGASFFDLYDIPIIRGRSFQAGDTAEDIVVSERLAERLWPGQNPLDRSFSIGRESRPLRVIGVAGEVRLPTLDPVLDNPEYYTPLGNESRTLYVNMRCRGTCPTEADIRAQIQSVHPALRARLASPADDLFAEQLRLPRATAQIGGLFAIVAVISVAGGLFSVLSYAVGRRRREFGIRAALGASPAQIHRLVVRDGTMVVGIGVVLGMFGGWIVARSLSSFQYAINGTDAVTPIAVLLTIAATYVAAAWRPARQAARFDPVALLRDE